jgi:hypothetical protein
MKVVEGVWGNTIAADYRRKSFPAKILREIEFWFLTALLILSIAVFGFAFGIAFMA